MKDKVERLKFISIVSVLIQIGILSVYIFLYGVNETMFMGLFFLVFESALLFYIISVYESQLDENILEISNVLGEESKDAFEIAGLGLVIYDNDYQVIWTSDYFSLINMNLVDERITSLMPELADLFSGDVDFVVVEYNDIIFKVSKNISTKLLYFKDITNEFNVDQKYKEEALVMGLVHLDNYQEYTQYEEEQRVYFIDSITKVKLIEWADNLGIFIKRLRNDRYLLLMNNKTYNKILRNNFTILNTIKKESQDNDLVLSLSMGIVSGSSNYLELEKSANELLELAISRGGDQVATKVIGKDVKYFGGLSESRERRSKTRVRVISQTLKDLIRKSDNVIIIGHRNSDFDCVGSSLGFSRIVKSYNKDVYIVTKTGGIESKLNQALESNAKNLNARHNFISEEEGLKLLTYHSLVVMLDHHSDEISNSPNIIERANKIVVIDHHRRKTDFNFRPVLSYIESAASSTSELVVEMLPYQESRVNINSIEATIMYTGIVVDTNGFINRTTGRTFESASELQKYGADLILSNQFLNDNFDELKMKNKIIGEAYIFDEIGVVIAKGEEDIIIERAILSQIADELINTQENHTSFVIGKISDNRIGISARSKGNINVSKIMEDMGGGGHFNAAALQRDNESIENLELELQEVVATYIKEVLLDESNLVS